MGMHNTPESLFKNVLPQNQQPQHPHHKCPTSYREHMDRSWIPSEILGTNQMYITQQQAGHTLQDFMCIKTSLAPQSLCLMWQVTGYASFNLPNETTTAQIGTVRTQPKPLMTAFPRSFDVRGNMPGHYTITTDSSIKPVQHAWRKVLIELWSKIEEKLQKIINQGAITPETRPMEWINSLTSLEVGWNPPDMSRHLRSQQSDPV